MTTYRKYRVIFDTSRDVYESVRYSTEAYEFNLTEKINILNSKGYIIHKVEIVSY